MTKRSIFLSLIILALVAIVVLLPYQRSSKASGGGLIERTKSHDDGLPNYDIRSDRSAFEKIAAYRSASAKTAAQVADIRSEFVAGEASLQQRVPTLKVEYNLDIRTPEVIAPAVNLAPAFLTGRSNAKRSETLRAFVKENNSLIGINDAQADDLMVTADYTNPDGNLSFAHLEQFVNGVPVFRGEVKAGFTKRGEMIRVINNLAPGLDYESLSSDFGAPIDAVNAALRSINHDGSKLDLSRNAKASTDLKQVFGTGDSATTAEKMYFPTEPGVAVPAWRVLIWQPVNAFYVIVDAHTGTMLWRKNITEDQTESTTMQVYNNPLAMVNSAESPAPLTPGPIDPGLGTQGPLLSRANVARVGNEAPYTFNNLGWINDGQNVTDGNSNEAGLDRVAPDGVDAPQPGDGPCPGAGCRVFTSTWNPPPGNPAPGDAPLTTQAQRGAVIQMFYTMNWYHDELYRLGFTEQARNFQNDNFGRGGAGADRIRSEGQDSSGTNNANFSTPADGGRGRMQMYIFTGPDPDRDGTTDVDIIYHEATHGTSNRLHGNGSGLSLNMSRGMGEGWSDFYAHAMLSQESDPLAGIYTTGGYVLVTPTYFGNFYYGIRRFPKAIMSFTGGPLNRPHNPLTFADIDGTQINTSDGAFPPRGGGSADQVHNAGEVWSSALWEVRAKYVTRLGWEVGNRRWLQFVTDGMKLAPLGPTFLTERDAIIAAALASGTPADVADVWAGFAIRGMGFSASIQTTGTGVGDARVTQAFDQPNLLQTPNLTVTDPGGDNDGFPEPGETISVNVPLTNNTGSAATGTTAQIVGGGSANYGTIANAQTVTQGISYTVPANTPCGSSVTLTININSSLGATSFNRTIIIGVPQTTFMENFDGVAAPALPAGWTAAVVQSGINFVGSTLSPDSAPNSAYALNPATVGGGTDLTSPAMAITASAATVSFRNRYDTEGGWDGGVLEISIGGGAFQDIITAGGRFIENGYNGVLGAGANNPLANRNSWNGLSNGYVNSTVQLPASAAGQNVQFRWRFGSDDNTVGQGPNPGWYIDGIKVVGSYSCSLTPSIKSRADFDGDGRTDVSVYRPSEGNWYLSRSTAGFAAVNWGLSTDIATPGDFDGDNRADTAVFRPSNGTWYVLNSSNSTFSFVNFGLAGDIPQSGDYDGDNRADFAVFRPTNNVWYVLNSGGGTLITAFGAAGDIPVRADYSGDGKTDVAIFRPSANQWWIASSSGGVSAATFGASGDKPVPADYDGDNKDDVAIYRPSTGQWWILQSSNGAAAAVTFGISTDIPVPGDYDGDGRDDQAIYRNGQWWLNRSTAGITALNFGLATDTPIPAKYVP
ncbi:MAG: M36 family metallopeptidase [Pyrinomonadaceae bacterium]